MSCHIRPFGLLRSHTERAPIQLARGLGLLAAMSCVLIGGLIERWKRCSSIHTLAIDRSYYAVRVTDGNSRDLQDFWRVSNFVWAVTEEGKTGQMSESCFVRVECRGMPRCAHVLSQPQ